MKHFNDIKSAQLRALDKEDLLSLLTSDDLRMNEESVWELVEELTPSSFWSSLIQSLAGLFPSWISSSGSPGAPASTGPSQ